MKTLYEKLICPACKDLRPSPLALADSGAYLVCRNDDCEMEYPIINGTPVMLTRYTDFQRMLDSKRGRDGKIL